MYNANLIVNSPIMAGAFRCKDCHMTFNNQQLLTKHKMKFCVGSSGDPNDLQLRRGLRSSSPPRIISPDDRGKVADPKAKPALEQKLNEIRKFKDNRAKKRELNDLEERMLLDKLQEVEQVHPGTVTPTKVLRSKSKMPLSKFKDIRDLQLEYEKQRELSQPKVGEIQVIESPRGGGTPYSRNSRNSRNSNSSMSVYMDDDYRRNPNQDQQLRNLAESHGRQMEYLQLRNRDLEKQREDIRLRLEGLGRKSVPPTVDNTQDLIWELREQEKRNQRNIDDLKRQLYEMNNNQKVNVIDLELLYRNVGHSIEMIDKVQKSIEADFEALTKTLEKEKLRTQKPIEIDAVNGLDVVSTRNSEEKIFKKLTETKKGEKSELNSKQGEVKQVLKKWKDFIQKNVQVLEDMKPIKNREIEKPVYPQLPPQQPPPPPPRQPSPEPKKNFVFPVFYGKSLVAEICAIRQAYLQNGGNDPETLAQMAQMQAEAQAIEDQMNKEPERKPKEKPKDGVGQLSFLELENERLKQELMLLQEQNVLAQQRRKSDKEDELERELRRLQREHLEKMYGLQKELDDLRIFLMMERNRPQPAPPQPSTIIHQPAQPPVSLKPYVEVEPMPPYDQYAGFVIFYDFILSLEPTIQACRLIVGLHSSSAVMGEPTVLPTVYTEPATRAEQYNYNFSNAVIGAKQPVPKCPPEPDLGIVAELQASGGPASEHDRHSLITRAWTKIPLFDNTGRIISGRFKIPMRNVPIKPFLHVSQVQKLPIYGEAMLYYRIVNMRDAEIQSMQQITASNYNQYTHPQWIVDIPELPVFSPRAHNIPPPPSPSQRNTARASAQRAPRYPEERLPSIQPRALRSTSPPQIMALQDMILGFQVDRVKHAEPGEGKVRLTAYYASSGKVVQSATSPVTCSTTAVRSNFKYGYHIFGQQEATFQEVEFQGDMVAIARFYLKKRQSDDDDFLHEPATQEHTLYDEETLVAWATLPLVNCNENLPLKKRKNFHPNKMSLNTGTHTLQLFQPPAPEPNQIPLDDHTYQRDWQRYGKATLRIYIFQGQPRPGSLTPSDISDIEDEDTLPEFAWLPLERKTPLKDPYLLGDGFDVYVDGCRYLPDSVTYTKVAGRILDRRYDVYGKDINTSVKLDSDVYNPVYEEKFEFRETNIPPTGTLLCKIYTTDNFYKTLTVVGYACLNIFVETGTDRQPVVDKPMQVSLNEGGHQLRLYASGPNGVDPLSESCLNDGGVRIIPCASLMVRLVKVARGSGGKALESSKVPNSDWLRMGLWQPRPKYTDRVYFSTKCMPTKGESRLFHSMMRRTRRTIREVIALVASAKESFLRSDKNMEEYVRTQLTKAPDAKPLDQDLNFICQYSPKHGIKVAIDSAVNLPWSNFTHAHMCLNPPAAFYLGAPHATYDKLVFTELLDVRSTNTSPAWKDGFKHFPRRSYHRFLTMIIHLQEIQVSVAKDNYKYGLLEQAWTAVQIFTDKYCTTQAFQLPLFAGSPSQTILKQLAREPCKEWMERMIRNNGIHLLEGTSIFVRVSDARRDDELVSDISHNKLVEVNTDYIPVGLEDQYSRERPGKPLESIVPSGKTPDQFVDNLKTKFKSLVYKLYEEGNVTKE